MLATHSLSLWNNLLPSSPHSHSLPQEEAGEPCLRILLFHVIGMRVSMNTLSLVEFPNKNGPLVLNQQPWEQETKQQLRAGNGGPSFLSPHRLSPSVICTDLLRACYAVKDFIKQFRILLRYKRLTQFIMCFRKLSLLEYHVLREDIINLRGVLPDPNLNSETHLPLMIIMDWQCSCHYLLTQEPEGIPSLPAGEARRGLRNPSSSRWGEVMRLKPSWESTQGIFVSTLHHLHVRWAEGWVTRGDRDLLGAQKSTGSC